MIIACFCIIFEILSFLQFSSSFIVSLCSKFKHNSKMSLITSSTKERIWNEELGIWSQNEIIEIKEQDFLDPLYIFGYGSLIWKPGPILEKFPSFESVALGYHRVFAQRSLDHRGTNKFPGLVLNIVHQDFLSDRNHFYDQDKEGCHGLSWLIPRDQIVATIEYLDEREKGGYTRHYIDVKLLQDTHFHPKDSIVKVLVYTGLDDNPNFFLPHQNLDESKSLSSLSKRHISKYDRYGLRRRSVAADIISTSIGASGRNLEYLFQLENYLHKQSMDDDYLVELCHAVRLRIGPWRKKQYSLRKDLDSRSNTNIEENYKISNQYLLCGWGSNENLQLSHNISNSSIEKSYLFPSPIELSEHLGNQTISSISWKELENYHLLAGGNSSGIISHDTLTLWGSLANNLFCQFEGLNDLHGINISFIEIQGLHGAALGYDHIVLLLSDETSIICLGNNVQGECSGPHQICLLPSEIEIIKVDDRKYRLRSLRANNQNITQSLKIFKIAAGLHHSAALTENGGLITWGESKNGQSFISPTCSDDLPYIWHPETNAKLIDLSCGSKHTVVLDENGIVYCMGSNKYGALGRKDSESTIKRVDLPEDIKFQRVDSGWSHVIARGINANGDLKIFAWGRRDLDQYIPQDSSLPNFKPQLLSMLPNNGHPVEIWCGSEFTIVADDVDGQLWGCGWNEHGNLGNGNLNLQDFSWKQVTLKSSHSLIVHGEWEGSVACGGSHVLCISKPHTFLNDLNA